MDGVECFAAVDFLSFYASEVYFCVFGVDVFYFSCLSFVLAFEDFYFVAGNDAKWANVFIAEFFGEWRIEEL